MPPDLLTRLPVGFEMWTPALQAAALFLSTFVLEDVAAVGAGLLLATGALAWPTAFWACFLGIWIGDAGLYALARVVGRNWFERSSLRRFSGRVAQSERWFAERGNSILIFSRLLPGARLPTYLAAGFLRLPLKRFLLITGAASLVWTLVILLLTHAVGAKLLAWLKVFQHGGWLILLVGPGMLAGMHFAKRWARAFGLRQSTASLHDVGVRLESPDEIPLAHQGQERGRSAEHRSAEAAGVPNAEQCPALRLTERTSTGRAIIRGWQRFSVALGRWRRWEFWPAWMFYPPVALYCLWLAVKHRGLMLPTAANPGIFSGGIVGESKMATLRELMATSPEFTAEAELLAGGTAEERLDSLREVCRRREISYPFILKPDVGQRGAGIKLIRAEEQALDYLRQTSAPLVLQRYAPGPHEIGVFYYRFPDEPSGRIFAITEKIFPLLTGDGRSTVAELVWNDPRARFMGDKYLARLKGRREEVLPAGATLKLVEAGNHAQGCIFRDGMRLCTPALVERIDALSQKLTGFHIGRYDLRYASEDDLRAGRNFQIIELNGAASEATSIYDARHSLLAAYRTLFRQWDLVFAIGAANRRRGCAPTNLSLVWTKWREYARVAATYPAAD
jgi:membrane protein DedA with SNARE-associated domain